MRMKNLINVLRLLIIACVAADADAKGVKDYAIQPVAFTSVHVNDGFWSSHVETNRIVTVWYDLKKCEESGFIDNFAKAGKQMSGEFQGNPFDDSDVYKVVEGAHLSIVRKERTTTATCLTSFSVVRFILSRMRIKTCSAA